ncbi:MAG: hypothetical protein ACRDV7_04605 [Acidimicrobiia bacterium]
MTSLIVLWCARLSWALLPLSAGEVLADALDSWSSSPALVATILLWTAWVIGLVALFAPRPWGLTALRVVAPSAVILTVISIPSTSAGSAIVAVASTLVAACFALSTPVAQAAGNALAYGDETRFPLRIPTPLLLAPVPAAVVLIAAGIALGPLLLADERVVIGAVALVVGFAVAAFLARSLHGLSRRWLVLVPAGVVVVDPLILADPALMRREDIVRLAGTEPGPRLADALDLRLGSTGRSITILLRQPVAFGRRTGRTGASIVATDAVVVAPVRQDALLAAASERRITT